MAASNTPEFRLWRRASGERFPPLTLATYTRLLTYGLVTSETQTHLHAGASAMAWVPSGMVGDLTAALTAAGYLCWCWPHDPASGMSRLRVTRVTPDEEAGGIP